MSSDKFQAGRRKRIRALFCQCSFFSAFKPSTKNTFERAAKVELEKWV
jgi:hypothetical protein